MSAFEVKLTNVKATRYRMPLKRAYGTARGVTTASINFLVELTATGASQAIKGVGECQPRHSLTGDGGKGRTEAWAFLRAAVDHLQGRTLRFTGRDEAIEAVRQTMAQLNDLARVHADERNRDRPFRGTLLGIEVALLDVVSQALDLQIAELLGKRRDEIGISISTISSSTAHDQVWDKVTKQVRFPMTRVKGIGDPERDLQLLDTVARANRSIGRERPLWIDINEAMDYDSAVRLVHNLADRMVAGSLPASLVLEGVLPKADVLQLPQLQRIADERCRESDGAIDLRIMPDEGMWDVSDLERVNSAGGCRAINIKAPKAGGLLASLDLANAAVAANPDVHLCIGGMVGTSDITAWALHNLARALPRVDYLTTVPPRNVAERISTPVARYIGSTSNVIAPQTTSGLGTRLLPEKVAPYVEATHEAPANSHLASGAALVQRSASSPSAASSSSKVLVFAGDTSLGDVYVNRRDGDLKHRLEQEPMSFFEGMVPLLQSNSGFVLNLETVLAEAPTSPFEGRKPYLGWDDPDRTINCLRDCGVTAVGLANNHTMDFGADHLIDMIARLERAGVRAFGAGSSQAAAAEPLTLSFDTGDSHRRIHVIAAMQVQARLRDEFQFYAEGQRPGVNGLSRSRIMKSIESLRQQDPTSLIVIFPHWGRNYQWTDDRQQRAATEFRRAGADLIIGHGAHMLQECSFRESHAVVYSLGNFMFNWAGRFSKLNAPPFGLVARVHLTPLPASWQVELRLYPITADNRVTDHRPAPVDGEAFDLVWQLLNENDIDSSFSKHARREQDEAGFFIAYDFETAHPEQDAPKVPKIRSRTGGGSFKLRRSDTASAGMSGARPAEAATHGDRGQPNVYDDPDSITVLGQLDRRLLSSILLSREAEKGGATIEWLASDTFLASLRGTELLFRGNRCTESVVATRIVRDKALLKRFLQKASVLTPRAGVARSMQEAYQWFEAIGAPVVVKPTTGDRGAGVTVGVTSEAELARAYEAAASTSSVLIEELVSGTELRCLATNAECIGVLHRDAPNVVGDGRSTLRELIEAKNSYRRSNPNLVKRLISVDEPMHHFLSRTGLTLESIPEDGVKVYVGGAGNITLGADSIDLADAVPAVALETAVDAVQAIPGLNWGGVDIILTAPSNEQAAAAYVLEVNVNAGISSLHYPMYGKPKNIAGRLWRQRLETREASRLKEAVAADTAGDPEVEPGGDDSTIGRIDLSKRLATYAAATGWHVERIAPRLIQVTRGSSKAYFYGCSGTDDRAVSAQVVNRRATLRKLLRRARVQVPPGQVVRSADDLYAFTETAGANVALLPARGRADRGPLDVIAHPSVRSEVEKAWTKAAGLGPIFVQALVGGSRATLLATRDAAIATLSDQQTAEALRSDQRALSQARRIAIAAVRAIPELRWASVEVVFPHPEEAGSTPPPSVESLSTDPFLPVGHQVIDGSIDSFLETILTSRKLTHSRHFADWRRLWRWWPARRNSLH